MNFETTNAGTTNVKDIDKLEQTQKTILLVDDDSKLLRALKRHLDEDYRVLTAISPGEAAVFLTQEKVDLILSDNLMSGELGTEFLASTSKKHPNIKLLMLSGYVPDTVSERVVKHCGVYKVLNKPCAITDVELAIRDALNQSLEQESDTQTPERIHLSHEHESKRTAKLSRQHADSDA